jgi:sarcosine oxidase subunit beta
MEKVSTVVVGGGIAGTAMAYYLAREGEKDILLVEGDTYGSGATAGSFGNVRQQFGTAIEVECSRRGLAFWKSVESVFDSPSPFHEDGYLLMTGNDDVATTLAQQAALQRDNGMPEVHILTRREITDVVPFIDPEGLVCGSYTPRDGHVTAQDGVNAYLKGGRALGVKYRQHWAVRGIERVAGGWQVNGPTPLLAQRVVVAAGAGTRDLLVPFGISLDMRSAKHVSVITEPFTKYGRVPTTIDLDLNGFAVEQEGTSFALAMLGRNPAPTTHQQLYLMLAEAIASRAPELSELGIAHELTAWPIMGGDGMPLVGEVENDLWAIAFTGHGVMHGPPIAEALTRTILGKPDETLDLTPWDIRREPGEHTVLWRRHGTS